MKKVLEYDAQAAEEAKKHLIMNPKAIAREYKIKVYGDGYNTLVGSLGLIGLFGVERANKFIARANKCPGDVCRCAVYGTGITVSFYLN